MVWHRMADSGIYDKPSYKYPIKAQVSGVNEDEGTVDIILTIGGTHDKIPITTPIVGYGDWGIFFMPTVGSWVYVIMRPNSTPVLLPYLADNWEETLKRTKVRKLRQGEIAIRSLGGSEIELYQDGSTILRDGRLGQITMDAVRQTIHLATNESVGGRGSSTIFRFGRRSFTTAETAALPGSAVALAGANLEGFDVTINQTVAGIPLQWIKIESGNTDYLPAIKNSALKISIQAVPGGPVTSRFNFDATTGSLEVENLKTKFGPINPLGTGILPGTTLPVAKMGDAVSVSADTLAWIAALNAAIKLAVPTYVPPVVIPSTVGNIVASATNLETA